MKKLKPIICFLFLAGLISLGSAISAQNFYVEVIDRATYRPLANVEVKLERDNVTMVFHTSSTGQINENIPSGYYRLTVTRTGYITQVREEFRIRPHELTTLNIDMVREGTVEPDPDTPSPADEPDPDTDIDTDTITETAEPAKSRLPIRRAPAYDAPERTSFASIGYQGLNIQLFQVNLGYVVYNDIFAHLSLGFKKQGYTSDFFINPVQEYDITFFNALLGAGYQYDYPLAERYGLFAKPLLSAGIELINNNDLINNDDINLLMHFALKPELRAGMYYDKFGFYLGLSFTQWISSPFSQERIIIEKEGEDPDIGEKLKWGEDLFNKRKGFGLTTGIVINF